MAKVLIQHRTRGLSGPMAQKFGARRVHSTGNALSLGGNLIRNPGFDSGDFWVAGVGWTIAGGVASCDGTANATLTQTVA